MANPECACARDAQHVAWAELFAEYESRDNSWGVHRVYMRGYSTAFLRYMSANPQNKLQQMLQPT